MHMRRHGDAGEPERLACGVELWTHADVGIAERILHRLPGVEVRFDGGGQRIEGVGERPRDLAAAPVGRSPVR